MKNEFYYPSKDGQTQLHAIQWVPVGEVKAVLQIIHGMVEHIERYDAFATYLAENGVFVTGHSHLGHGKSMVTLDKMGYFAAIDGNECVIGDIHSLRTMTREKYPEKPYVMLGHSMGSFLLRQYLGRFGDGISGAIIMGTGDQPDIAVNGGKVVCKLIALVKGWEHRSAFVNGLVIGGFEKKMGKGWLSRNEENVKIYTKDPLSGFVFTLNAFYHMFDGMRKMNAQENSGTIQKELPMFFVAGGEDPVGANGKGVEAVCRRYQKKGAKNVSIKIYEGNRHEILNEIAKSVVYKDLLSWILELKY